MWTLAPHRELAVAPAEIRVRTLTDGGFEVSSPVYCHAVHVEDRGRTLLSDNWFDLLPGVPVKVAAVGAVTASALRFEAVTGKPATRP